jgi:hypothetical protein
MDPFSAKQHITARKVQCLLSTKIYEKPQHQFITLNLVSKYVIPRRLNYIHQHFGTLCLFHLHTYPPMKIEQSDPKHLNIKFKSRGITQKKSYNFQKMANVWNQVSISHITPFVNRNLNRVGSKCNELSVRQICNYPTPQNIIAMTCTFSLLEYDFYLNNTGWFKRKCQYLSVWET